MKLKPVFILRSQSKFLLFIPFLVLFLLLFNKTSVAQETGATRETMEVGVARVDITPEIPIRLTGYAAREEAETDSVFRRLRATALVLGSDAQNPTVIITVDLIGITRRITSKVVDYLSNEKGIPPAQIAIFASHTHSGPEIGSLMNILLSHGNQFSDSLPLNQLIHIAKYTEELTEKLKEVAVSALKNRRPAYVSWGKGQVSFAVNRRTKGGPVNLAMPMLKITNPDGSLRAVFLNYASHATTLTGEFNIISGDWIGQAVREIESRHPGATALIAIGTAGDINPSPRGTIEDVKLHGKQIADMVDKLLDNQLEPLNSPPVGKMKWIQLPLKKIPTVPELVKIAKKYKETVKGYMARRTLERIVRGEATSTTIEYPIQVWNFDNKMIMINLGGEVVVDYSLLLRKKYGGENVWVNAYANHVPAYIPSKRILKEGGYEAVSNMYWYNHPSIFTPEVQDIILDTIDELMPAAFKTERPVTNHQELIQVGEDGTYILPSWLAGTVGKHIEYMPDWKAFGWFKTTEKAIWKVDIKKPGQYNIYIEYTVSDDAAGKHFVVVAGDRRLTGKVEKSGSWFTFEIMNVGSIYLEEGIQKIVLKSESKVEKGSMFDVRKIKLVPVE